MGKNVSRTITGILVFVAILTAGVLLQPEQSTQAALIRPNRVHIGMPGSGVVPMNNMTITTMAPLTNKNVWLAGWYTNDQYWAMPLFEHFNGSTWSVVTSPDTGYYGVINSLFAVSANNIWAVGSMQADPNAYNTDALVEHWDGSRWTIIPTNTPDTVASANLSAVAGTAANNVWFVGSYQDAVTNLTRTFIEHWDGHLMQPVASPNIDNTLADNLFSLSATTANDIWAVGQATSQQGNQATLTEHYDGAHWTIVPSPNANQNPGGTSANWLNSVSATHSNDVWTVGNTQGPRQHPVYGLTEHYNGSAWQLMQGPTSPGTSQALSMVFAFATKNAWALGTYANGGPDNPLVEHYDGTTWSVISLPPALTSLSTCQRLGKTSTLYGIGTYNGVTQLVTLSN